MLLPALNEHINELALFFREVHTAEEDVRNGHADGDAQDDERRADGVVHTHRHLAYDTVHIYEREQGAIHQHTGNHRDNAWNGDAMVRSV